MRKALGFLKPCNSLRSLHAKESPESQPSIFPMDRPSAKSKHPGFRGWFLPDAEPDSLIQKQVAILAIHAMLKDCAPINPASFSNEIPIRRVVRLRSNTGQRNCRQQANLVTIFHPEPDAALPAGCGFHGSAKPKVHPLSSAHCVG